MLQEAEDAVHQQPGAKPQKRRADNPDSARKKPKVEVINVPPEELPAYHRAAPTKTIKLPSTEPQLEAIPDPAPEPAQEAAPPAPIEHEAAPARQKRPYKRRSLIPAKAATYPCLFCPSSDPTDRMHVQDPSDEVKKRWKGEGAIMAHIRCAQATPEVNFADAEVDGEKQVVVVGVNTIPKDRWRLVSFSVIALNAEMQSLHRQGAERERGQSAVYKGGVKGRRG